MDFSLCINLRKSFVGVCFGSIYTQSWKYSFSIILFLWNDINSIYDNKMLCTSSKVRAILKCIFLYVHIFYFQKGLRCNNLVSNISNWFTTWYITDKSRIWYFVSCREFFFSDLLYYIYHVEMRLKCIIYSSMMRYSSDFAT